jgi:lysophospholipase L1-like esterase
MAVSNKTLAINLATVAAVLILLELMCRFELKKVYNRYFDKSLIVDNKYCTSAGLKPNALGIVWGKNFSTDSFGCRIPAKPYHTKKKKWLFIGDSVTEGVGVDDSSTFAYKVSEQQDSLNIMNYSLIGYSDADYLNILKTLLAGHDTTISRVSIFFCLNDVYGNTATHDLPVMAKQNLVGRLNGFLQKYYATYKLLKLLIYQNSAAYFKYDLSFYNASNKQFTDAMQILQQCDSVCRLAGVKLDVVILPYRSQLLGKYKGNTKPQQMVAGFCARNNISFYDPYSALLQAAPAASLYLFADEIHFSPTGHDAMAHFIVSH